MQVSETLDWIGRSGVPLGDWQSTTMPDTLDLAEHARLAVRALTQLDPNASYACCQMFDLNMPGPLKGRNWTCMLKYLRALPRIRTMSGSDQKLDAEIQAMRMHHMFTRATLNGDVELATRGLSEIARLRVPVLAATPSTVKELV